MKEKKEITIVNKTYLEDKIYIIRGQKVMLDSDLAEIYGYLTKDFNRQVKNNIDKFEEDFMFQLTSDEVINLSRCNFCTSIIKSNKTIPIMQTKGIKGGRVYRPFVFTEQGIYMLMTVLKGELAVKQSKALIRLFKSMKDYITENKDLLSNKGLEVRTSLLEKNVDSINNHLDTVDNSLNKVMEYFEDKDSYKHFLILNGQKLDADSAYRKIFKLAKHSIIYIDDYINQKTLEMLSLTRNNVAITIISDNKAKDKVTANIINDFNIQNKTNKLSIINSNNKCHDRFIIIDFNMKNEKIFHCGASLKDAGNKITAINKIENIKIFKNMIKELLNGIPIS